MVNAVIIQRVVPHYRVPLFENLYRRFGWQVACAEPGANHGLATARPDEHEWLHAFAFGRSHKHQYRATVPVPLIMRQLQPEALVCEFSLQLSSTWRLALLGSPVPFAFWSQGWNRERGFESVRDRLIQKLRLSLMRRADAQIVYSEGSAHFLEERLGGGGPVFVASNALAMDTMPGRDIDASPTDPSAPHVINVGRLTADKHVPRVIEAFLQIRDAFPGARMTVVGDGPDMPAVKTAAAKGDGCVELRGAVYADDEIGKVFQSASLLVIGGSVGLTVNHALAYGVPVMIFDDKYAHHHHPEHEFVIDGLTGYRVKGDGVPELAAAMRRALAAPGPRAQLGRGLRAHVEKELTLDRMIDGFARLDAFFENRA